MSQSVASAPRGGTRNARHVIPSFRMRALSVCGFTRSIRAAPVRPSTRPWATRSAASTCRRITTSSGAIDAGGATSAAHDP